MSYEDMKGRITGELKRVFRPEFLNRVDEVIVFHKLDREEIRRIVDLLIARLQKQISASGIVIQLTDAGRDLLVDKGFDPGAGARGLCAAPSSATSKTSWPTPCLSGSSPKGTVVLVDAADEDTVLSVNGERVGGSVELPLVGMDEPRGRRRQWAGGPSRGLRATSPATQCECWAAASGSRCRRPAFLLP